MLLRKIFRKINSAILNSFLSAEEKNPNSFNIEKANNILIIRQHNQFGDMLASVSLFKALKEKYPECKITLLASPENFYAVEKNNLINELFVFDKKKLFSLKYIKLLWKLLKKEYDLSIVPVTVAISNTSCILCALSNSKNKIGPSSLNKKDNSLKQLFNYRIKLDWSKYIDAHVSDFILDIVRPFNITTKDYTSTINYDEDDIKFANDFIKKVKSKNENLLFGFHVGAAKPQNRWSLVKYVELINTLKNLYGFDFYFTGSNSDKEQIDYMKKYFPNAGYFLNNKISQVAALISLSDLFITNDTGVMHVAGTTDVRQISLFGPTNPFNWAPLGKDKYFIRKSELIDDIQVDDVIHLVKIIFNK
ncbi:MAG: glycosyltransferase family 9 protein [Melioribacteraceae bacterium]|nr:glycosyltransferase family 9 protein [Melioribacteraceae bacterium]